MLPKMSAEFVAESSPRFISTLKSQKVVEDIDVQLSCTVSGNPEPEVTWYKGDKQLTKVLGLPKYETLKDDKVHTLRLYRCTEGDAAIYQVSARNSRGIAACSCVLQVGFVTEAQVRQQLMQKLRDRSEAKKTLEPRTPESDGPVGWRCDSKSSKDDISNTAAQIHVNATENRVPSPAGGQEADGHNAASPGGKPPGARGFTSVELMDKVVAEANSAVPRLPNTAKRHRLTQPQDSAAGGAGEQSSNSRPGHAVSPQSSRMRLSQSSGSDSSGVRRCKPGRPPHCAADPGHLSAEDEYYLDCLVCSDLLSDQDNARWQHRLDCPCHSPLAQSKGPETDGLKITCSPLGHPQPPARAVAMDITGASVSPSRDTDPRQSMSSAGSFSLRGGRPSASEMSRAVGEGGGGICPSSAEDRPELPTLTSSHGPQENHGTVICQKEDTSTMESAADTAIALDMFEADKVTEVEREKVLQKNCPQEPSQKQKGNRLESRQAAVNIFGGVILAAGELFDTGALYTTLPAAGTVETPGDIGALCTTLPAANTAETLRDIGAFYTTLPAASTVETPGDTTSTGRGSNIVTDTRLKHESRHPVKTSSLGNGATPRQMDGVAICGQEEEVEMGSEEKHDGSSERAEIQLLLLNDGETSFIKNTVSLTNCEDNHITCHDKKSDLLPLDTYVTLSSQQDNHDHEAGCGRLSTDCKILRNALIVESVVSQSSDFKDKYHVQDKDLLREKKSSFITKDDDLICISKEYQESNSDYKAKTGHTRQLTEPLIRDCCIQSKNSDLYANSSICDKELEPLEQPSELYIHNKYIEHPSSIVCNGSESDIFKKEDTRGSIDPCLDIQPCLTIPVQIQDGSESLDTSSNTFLIGGKLLDKESKSSLYININDDPGSTHDESTLQVSECYRNDSSQMDACGHEFRSIEVVCPIAILESYNMYQEPEFEESVLENETSQKSGAKSLSLNRSEKHNQILHHLEASENKVHKEHRSTHQSMQCTKIAENEAHRTCLHSHNNKEISGFPETSRSVACQLDEQLPIEQPVLFECNLEIQSNQLIPFNSKDHGSEWPSKEIECKPDCTVTEPLVVTHQETNTFTLVHDEKMQNDEPFLLESLCWNSTGNKTKNINHEVISNVTYVESEAPCKTEDGVNNDHRGDVISDNHDEQICKQFYNSTEIVKSPVSCPPTENQHFNFQSRIGQTPNSETVLDLKDHLMYNDEPEVVKSDSLQSSMSWLTKVDQNISPLPGRNQRRMINIQDNNAVNIMEYSEYPAPKEQKSFTTCSTIIDQSISLQEITRPVQNSMECVAEVDMEDDSGRVQHVEDVQSIVIDSLESSLIDGQNLNKTQRIQPALHDESHFECLSVPVAEETKATDNIHDIDINATANFKYSEDSSSHFDETMIFQSQTSQVEKNSENHAVISAECDSELGQGHINAKTMSIENLKSATFSVASIIKVPSKTEQVKDIKARSATIDLNENTQKVGYLHDRKANLSEISKCFVTNMDKIVGIQSKEGQLMKETETAVVTEENNKTIQHNDFFPLSAVNSIGSSITAQRVVGEVMNINSIAAKNCRERNKRPTGSNLNQSNYTAVMSDHPLECIKMDINAECKGKSCQMSTLPSKSNQKFSNGSKIENIPLDCKNDNQTEPPRTQTMSKVLLYERQKKTIDPEPHISIQTKSLTEKSILSIPSHNKQQTTAVRVKQPLLAASAKELMSGARKKANFLKPSNEAARATTEIVGPAPSLNDQQKKEAVKRIRMSADNVGKSVLEKSKLSYSSAGKENLNKNVAVIKRMYQKTNEEPAHKKEHKELKKVKHHQKDEHKAPKLIQKIHAELFPDLAGSVKLWGLFSDIHADSTIIWTKDGVILTKMERSAGDDSPVSLAIVQTTRKDRGLYQCSLKNMYGSVSCEFDFTTEVLNELLSYQVVEGQSIIESVNPEGRHAIPGSVAGEEIVLFQPIVGKELINECNFDVKMCGSIATEELHFGEGLHRKAFRTKVIYGLVPLFDPGHSCVLKIHNAISYGTKTNSEIIQRNYVLAVQECHVQNAARQYGNMFSAEGALLEGFGEAPEVIPIYLIHRPANNIPYATVEDELIGEFVKYSVKDGRELNVGRRISEVGQKCCTFQHWVYQWTEGNLLVTDMQGVGMKLTDVGIATCSKGYKGFKGNCSVSFIDQFRALHQCNMYCKIMGLKSLKVSQHKPRRIPPMKTQVLQPTPCTTKKMPLSPRSTRRGFTSQAKSISGDKILQKHL
uniref:alpha-protein kinase 2 n=1 Tax=Pristiophorus japonicus TaxID=55135 RepID=UPI00398EAC5E